MKVQDCVRVVPVDMNVKISDTGTQDEAEKTSCVKYRYVQIALLYFMVFSFFCMRNCLSVAIVAMTNSTSSNPEIPSYQWGNTNIILSSFYWSYACLQFFSGHISTYFGAKWILFATGLVNSLATLLIPTSARYFGANGVMTCRLVQGLFQGLMLPLINNILGRWIPPNETSNLGTIIYSGVHLGIIFSMVLTGYLSASSWGWPSAFYFFGSVGLIWCIFWLIFSANSPSVHKKITLEERKYIEQSLNQEDDHLIATTFIPWKAIFMSLPYWAIIFGAIGESWGNTLLSSELPTYFSKAVGLSIENSSLLSALPTAVGMFATLAVGQVSNFIINRKFVSKVNARRFMHGLATVANAGGLFILPYVENEVAIEIILVIAIGVSAAYTCGHLMSPVDISPRFAGALSGISNGTGQLFAIFAPILVHFVVHDESEKASWRLMFMISAAIIFGTGILFIIFCSGIRQWWDDIKGNPNEGPEQDLPTYSQTNQAYENDHIL